MHIRRKKINHAFALKILLFICVVYIYILINEVYFIVD